MPKKKALIIRLGAYGDMLIITPVLKRLKDLGYYIILNTGKRGIELLGKDKRVDKIIPHDENYPLDKLEGYWESLKKKHKPDLFLNFTSSIENNLALHPTQPLYSKPKYLRMAKCNKNYYEETIRLSGLDKCNAIPSLKFTEEEEDFAKGTMREGKFNIVWCLSGSGKNKVYPWTEFVMGSLFNEYKDVHVITVGDTRCKILENINSQLPPEHFTELAGETTMRKAMCLTKYADLVVSPDTGILHSSGCWKTPKIGLLGHTTKKNITKTFENDFSLEADCGCAPCFYLIYEHNIQCPIEVVTHAAWCMSVGIPPEKLLGQIRLVKEIYGSRHSKKEYCTA